MNQLKGLAQCKKCFICLKQCLNEKDNESKDENYSTGVSSRKSKFQNIFRYLGIHLEWKSHCDLNTNLCGECKAVLERFSEHYLVMELCRMEIEGVLAIIKQKLISSENNLETANELNLHLEDNQNYFNVDKLRKKFSKKCSEKLLKSSPRLILKSVEENIHQQIPIITEVDSSAQVFSVIDIKPEPEESFLFSPETAAQPKEHTLKRTPPPPNSPKKATKRSPESSQVSPETEVANMNIPTFKNPTKICTRRLKNQLIKNNADQEEAIADINNQGVSKEEYMECSSDSYSPLSSPPSSPSPSKTASKRVSKKSPSPRKLRRVQECNLVKTKKQQRRYDRTECPICSKSLTHQSRIKKHILLEHPNSSQSDLNSICSTRRVAVPHLRLKCPEATCPELFMELHSLQTHCKDVHNVTKPSTAKLIIELVSYAVDPESELYKKLNSDLRKYTHLGRIEIDPLGEDQTVLVCKVNTCNRRFYSEADLEAHKKLHGNFKCSICPETKTFLPELAVHEYQAHGGSQFKNRTFKCQRCNQTLSCVVNYLRHFTSEHFSLNFTEQSCPICKTYLLKFEKNFDGKQKGLTVLFHHYKDSHNLEVVDKSRHGFKGKRCEEPNCSVFFSTLTALTNHRRLDHQLDEEKMDDFKIKRKGRICEECGKVFKDCTRLELHRLVHAGPDAWKFCCEICSKKCMTKFNLELHLRVHAKEKTFFVCEICGLKYAHKHNLRIHMDKKHANATQDVPEKGETNAGVEQMEKLTRIV